MIMFYISEKQEETEQLTKQKENDTRPVNELTKKLEVEAKKGRAKILEIEELLTRQKEGTL